AAARDRELLAVDESFELAVDGVEEVVAVKLDVEREQVVAQQAVEQLALPGADPEDLGVGPGNVPELEDDGRREPLLDHARQQGEMVVLDEDERALRARL